MPEIRRATVKSYDGGTHKASVQIGGSLGVWLDAVPVATDVPAADVVAGRSCSVLFLDEHNPADAVVLEVHGALPSGGGGGTPTEIRDADADTGVRAEQSPDEDMVRVRVAGVERGLWQTTLPHITLSGNVYLPNTLGVGKLPVSNYALDAQIGGTFGSGNVGVIQAQPSGLVATGNNMGITGFIGAPVGTVGAATTGQNWDALNYALLITGGSGATVAREAGIFVRAGLLNFTGTITDLIGAYVQAPFYAAPSSTTALSTMLYLGDAAPSNRITNAYGLRIDDISQATGFRRLIEAGGSIGTLPNLRVEANAPTNPGASKGRSRILGTFNENGTNTLRRVEWKDYATLTAGDRVLVAV
jgi:hypothetical protein